MDARGTQGCEAARYGDFEAMRAGVEALGRHRKKP